MALPSVIFEERPLQHDDAIPLITVLHSHVIFTLNILHRNNNLESVLRLLYTVQMFLHRNNNLESVWSMPPLQAQVSLRETYGVCIMYLEGTG